MWLACDRTFTPTLSRTRETVGVRAAAPLNRNDHATSTSIPMTPTPEHTLLRDTVRAFIAAEIAPHLNAWDEADTFPRTLYQRAAHIGLPPIVAHGSEALKQRVIPGMLAGVKIAALAITEPSGGSNRARLRCTAQLEANSNCDSASDADGAHCIIDNDKNFITSGLRTDWITLAVRTGTKGSAEISLIVAPGDTPGITRTPLAKLGWWCSDTAQLHLDHGRVPADHLIGPVNAGFRMVIENFNGERPLMSAGACAFAQVCGGAEKIMKGLAARKLGV